MFESDKFNAGGRIYTQPRRRVPARLNSGHELPENRTPDLSYWMAQWAGGGFHTLNLTMAHIDYSIKEQIKLTQRNLVS